jgi:hypothetical protein
MPDCSATSAGCSAFAIQQQLGGRMYGDDLKSWIKNMQRDIATLTILALFGVWKICEVVVGFVLYLVQ